MNGFEKFKNTKWSYLVDRREALLFISITCNSYNMLPEVTGFDWHCEHVAYASEGVVLIGDKEMEDLDKIIKNSEIINFKNFIKKLKKEYKKYIKISKILENSDFTFFTDDDLYKELKKYYNQAQRIHVFLAIFSRIDRFLTNKIREWIDMEKDKKDEIISKLIYPKKMTDNTKEQIDFLKLIVLKKNKKDKKYRKALKKHLQKYKWIGARGYHFFNEWTEKDLVDRVEEFCVSEKDAKEELYNLKKFYKIQPTIAKEVFKKIKINNKNTFLNLLYLTRQLAYLRTWRTDNIYLCGYRARNLFFEIAQRSSLDVRDVEYISILELLDLAKRGKVGDLSQKIEQRKQAFLSCKMDDRYIIYQGQKNCEDFFVEMRKYRPQKNEQVKGVCAFCGVVRGRVKKVLSMIDLKKINSGDILISVMTFPNFISAMEKASAFVTDEGGVLCHAAIIAREMKKPCIIGTKIATQVFKDGDIVEVDAEKGVVRKIK